MCGICGFVDLFQKVTHPSEIIRQMNQILFHRGPDEDGFYVDKKWGIYAGMRRLSIIDLNHGQQPIFNENENIAVMQNGEVFNFQEIKVELENKGHVFLTHCDTEVLVHAYEEYGIDFVHHFNGMFAIALFDKVKNRVVLARDRMGVKPLFYFLDSEKLVFASEIKSVLCFPGIERRVNPKSLVDFLSLNYVVAPETLFNGIRQILPGELATFDLETKRFQKKKYWSIKPQIKHNISENEAIETVEYLLRDSIKKRLISDVPLGAFLSGGIDSSAIVAIMSEYITRKPLQTFTVGFDEPSYDETKWAKLVSQLYQTQNHEILLNADSLNILPLLVWHSEEPTADSSALPAYYVSKCARDAVTVILSGDGADEIFCGYSTYDAPEYLKIWKKIPRAFRNLFSKLILALPERTIKKSPEMLMKRFVKAAEFSPEEAHFMWRMIFYENERKSVINQDFFSEHQLQTYNPFTKMKPYFDEASEQDFLTKLMYVDASGYLPNDMLARMDRVSMAVSLETRVPFMDYRLIEYVFNLPTRIKYKDKIKKYLLKKIFHDTLPHDVLYRKKQGFNVPIGHWFRTIKSRRILEIVNDLAPSLPFLNVDSIKKVLQNHNSGKSDNGFKIWSLLVLIIWYHTFFLRKDFSSPMDLKI